MRQRLNFLAVGVVCVVITYYSINKPVSVAGAPSSSNYILHGLAYFGLSAVLLLHFHPTKHGIIESILLASAVGLGIEIIQFNLSYRTFSVYDLLSNVLGASIVVFDYHGFAADKIVALEDKILEKYLGLKSYS